jgi:hypothetical protein
MEKHKLDNGMLPLAWLCNVVFPGVFGIYYGIRDLLNDTSSNIMMVSIAVSFAMLFLIIFYPYRRIEFDRHSMYIKNMFNIEVARIDFAEIESFEQGLLNFGKEDKKIVTGKNYTISYKVADGSLRTVKVMATSDDGVITRFGRFVEDKGRFADIIS